MKTLKSLSKKQKIILGVLSIIIAIAIPTIIFILSSKKPENNKKIEKPKTSKKIDKPKPKEKFYASLSGVEVSSKEEVNKPVIGVIIENSTHARPQSGLKDAEVVFEAIAEGGITRLLALYQQNQPEIIGPVRSLRSYYIDWASGFQSSVAHVGGSGDALSRIRNGQYRDIDEFFNTSTFWRARGRWAPHNVYTNYSNLINFHNSKGWNNSNFEGFSRKDERKSPNPNATQIQVNISGALYNSFYNYNSDCNCYFRGQAGGAHLDREKGDITPKVIVALKIPMILASDGLHNHYSTIGSGSGMVFQDGVAEEVVWEKLNEFSPLTLKKPNGEKLNLNRGQTWITAIPSSSGSVSWK